MYFRDISFEENIGLFDILRVMSIYSDYKEDSCFLMKERIFGFFFHLFSELG
jgi:hypothetical protein